MVQYRNGGQIFLRAGVRFAIISVQAPPSRRSLQILEITDNLRPGCKVPPHRDAVERRLISTTEAGDNSADCT
jgi:hypothetical protein